MPQPLLSIVIPTYNRSSMLRQTLDSIAGQTVIPDGLEVIVSNDCSTDDTREVLEAYRERMPYLRVFHQEKNLTPEGNWGFVQDQARGEYLFILCDDDAVAPDFLETYLKRYADDPTLDMVFGDIEIRDPEFRPLAPLPLGDTPEGYADGPTRCLAQLKSHHMVMSTMYRRSTFLEAGGWDGRVGGHLDCNAFCRTALRARNTYRVGRTMLYFRMSPVSWSSMITSEKSGQVAGWYRRKLDNLVADARQLAPRIVPDLRKMYPWHARLVLSTLELQLAHHRISGPAARSSIRGLTRAFPESRLDPMTAKVVLATYFGTGWLTGLRKVLGKSDPYQTNLELFSRFTGA